MSVRVIQDRLNGFGCRSTIDEEQALREITLESRIGRRPSEPSGWPL